MIIEFSDQFVLTLRSRKQTAGLGKRPHPAGICFEGGADRKRNGKVCFTRNTDFIAHLPLDARARLKHLRIKVLRHRQRHRQEDLALVGKGHQITAKKGGPFGNRPLDLPHCRAGRQLPVNRARRFTTVTAKFPVGMPVFNRVKADCQPGSLAGHDIYGLRDQLNLDLISLMHLRTDSHREKIKRDENQ